MSIRNQKDFAAGVIYVFAGAGFALGALNYTVGEAARMGPGWFPLWIGILLAVVGLVVVAGSVRATATPDRLQPPQLGSLAWILGGVVLFGLLLQPAGLVIALAVLVLVASRASHEFSWRAAILNAVFLILFAVAVFIEGINLQLRLWPAFLSA
ncbi:MAG: tripartite tricarboxylate transporter TctB family protein [Ramlibacter sp.]